MSGTASKKIMVFKHPDGIGTEMAARKEMELCRTENEKDPDGNVLESTRKIFVGGLAWSTTAETLTEYFSRFGKVANAYIIMDTEEIKSRGFGFVEFESPASVTRVLEQPHFRIDGRSVECKPSYSRDKATSYDDRRVKVAGLPSDCVQRSVIEAFAKLGKIEHVKFDYEPEGGCTAYITYSGKSGINTCLQKKSWTYNGKAITVSKTSGKDGAVSPSSSLSFSRTGKKGKSTLNDNAATPAKFDLHSPVHIASSPRTSPSVNIVAEKGSDNKTSVKAFLKNANERANNSSSLIQICNVSSENNIEYEDNNNNNNNNNNRSSIKNNNPTQASPSTVDNSNSTRNFSSLLAPQQQKKTILTSSHDTPQESLSVDIRATKRRRRGRGARSRHRASGAHHVLFESTTPTPNTCPVLTTEPTNDTRDTADSCTTPTAISPGIMTTPHTPNGRPLLFGTRKVTYVGPTQSPESWGESYDFGDWGKINGIDGTPLLGHGDPVRNVTGVIQSDDATSGTFDPLSVFCSNNIWDDDRFERYNNNDNIFLPKASNMPHTFREPVTPGRMEEREQEQEGPFYASSFTYEDEDESGQHHESHTFIPSLSMSTESESPLPSSLPGFSMFSRDTTSPQLNSLTTRTYSSGSDEQHVDDDIFNTSFSDAVLGQTAQPDSQEYNTTNASSPGTPYDTHYYDHLISVFDRIIFPPSNSSI